MNSTVPKRQFLCPQFSCRPAACSKGTSEGGSGSRGVHVGSIIGERLNTLPKLHHLCISSFHSLIEQSCLCLHHLQNTITIESICWSEKVQKGAKWKRFLDVFCVGSSNNASRKLDTRIREGEAGHCRTSLRLESSASSACAAASSSARRCASARRCGVRKSAPIAKRCSTHLQRQRKQPHRQRRA